MSQKLIGYKTEIAATIIVNGIWTLNSLIFLWVTSTLFLN